MTFSTTSTAQPKVAQRLQNPEKIHRSITINKSPAEIYTFFRNFANLPYFMKDLIALTVNSETMSHWVVQLEHGPKVEWNAEITEDKYAETISWRTVGKTEVEQAGTIWFSKAPRDLGTVVRLHMAYTIPAGKLGKFATHLVGEDPDSIMLINLSRLKAYLETGEIPTTKGQPSGRDEDLAPEMKH
ncbi:cyclase [Bdellovibrio sp. qaytius]|nr:cyclase [Bdellovibrio sp. qaytius]